MSIKPKTSNKNNFFASIFIAFVVALLFYSLYYLIYNPLSKDMILNFLVPYGLIVLISYLYLSKLDSKLNTFSASLVKASIFGLVIAITLVILPKVLPLSSELIESHNLWGLIIVITATLTFLSMAVISTLFEFTKIKSKNIKFLTIFGKTLLFYFVLYISVIVISVLWLVIRHPII